MSSRRVAHGPPGAAPQRVNPLRAVPEICTPDPARAVSIRGVRTLLVAASPATRARLSDQLAEAGARCIQTDSAEDLPELLAAHRFELILLDADMGPQSHELAGLLSQPAAHSSTAIAPSVVIVADHPAVDQAIAAMRAGACDLIPSRLPHDELVSRLAAAADRSLARRAEARRTRRLKRLCRRLNCARREVVGQIESLCDDLAGAYERMSDQMTRVAISSEFNSLVRQELDVEGLLRTVLEYTLAKIGPTNAAVFLPSSTGEHTLGAYVNYDVPKDAAEVLLDHLTTVIPHRFESLPGPRCLSTERELDAALDQDAHWLEGRALVVLPCRQDGQTLAVVALFRDTATPFTPAHLESCDIIAELFGKQIGRVIHVHHRHLPTDEWGLPGDPSSR